MANSGIVLGGSGANRTVAVTPVANASGTATITVTVSDGSLTASDTFVLTVTAVNDPPTISSISSQATAAGVAVGPLALTVGDIETAAASLTLSAASSDTVLVPVANIVFGGSGANRTVTVTPGRSFDGCSGHHLDRERRHDDGRHELQLDRHGDQLRADDHRRKQSDDGGRHGDGGDGVHGR